MYFANAAVFVASAGNLQRLRFSVITPDNSDGVFSLISLGGYLPQEQKPTYEQRPSSYIVISSVCEQVDTNLAMDVGIAAEAISLSVAEAGFASCMIRNFKAGGIAEYIGRDKLYPILLIAIGEPAETVRIVDSKDGDVKYYRDSEGVHCVPKLSRDELIIMK
jgi:nitroreductase